MPRPHPWAAQLAELPPLLTKADAARVLRVGQRTIDRWRAQGRLRSVRPVAAGSGRVLIPRDDVARLLGEQGGAS